MSIKTLPANNGRPVMLALLLSVIAHGVLAGLLVVMPAISESLMGRLTDEPSEPVIVDVIELPPVAASTRPTQRPSFYSDMDRSVVKETWPLPQPAQTVVAGRSPSIQPTEKMPPSSSASGGGDTHAGQPAAVSRPSAAEAGGNDSSAATAKAGKPLPVVPRSSAVDKAAGARPKLFPSKERLTELAGRYAAEAPKGETGKVLSLNTSEVRYQKYLINMKNRIENLWEYPPVAVRNGWQGKLNIDFTIKRDGTVSEIRLVKSSNNPVLDDAAVTVLRLAEPFTPFPDDFAVEEITIKGEFVYLIANAPMR